MKTLSRAAVISRPVAAGWAPWAIALVACGIALCAAPVPDWAWAALRLFLQV